MKKSKFRIALYFISETVSWILLTMSVLLFATVLYSRISNNGIPFVFSKGAIVIVSNSMDGTYNIGDVVFVTKLDNVSKENLKAGDIITFHSNLDINGDGKTGDLNTHRVVFNDTENCCVTTKGDNNPANDRDPIEYVNIIGLCYENFKIPYIGVIFLLLLQPVGYFTLALIFAIIFFVYSLCRFLKEIKLQNKKENTSQNYLKKEYKDKEKH